MSGNSVDISPLRRVADQLDRWSRDGELFWTHRVELMMELEQMRQSVRDIVVWLELRGVQAAADEVDDAMASVREAALEFAYECEHGGTYPPDSERCRAHHERMLNGARESVDQLGSVDDELPAGTFGHSGGFDDE